MSQVDLSPLVVTSVRAPLLLGFDTCVWAMVAYLKAYPEGALVGLYGPIVTAWAAWFVRLPAQRILDVELGGPDLEVIITYL